VGLFSSSRLEVNTQVTCIAGMDCQVVTLLTLTQKFVFKTHRPLLALSRLSVWPWPSVGWRSFDSLLQTCLSLRHVFSDVSCCPKCSHRNVLCVARPSPRHPAEMKVPLVLQLLSATVALCAAEDNRLG